MLPMNRAIWLTRSLVILVGIVVVLPGGFYLFAEETPAGGRIISFCFAVAGVRLVFMGIRGRRSQIDNAIDEMMTGI